MKRILNKLATIFASSAFALAIVAANAASRQHMCETKEPKELEKYKLLNKK